MSSRKNHDRFRLQQSVPFCHSASNFVHRSRRSKMRRLQILRFCFTSLLFLCLTESCTARRQPWAVERTDCDVERYVELGHAYEFDSFPPRPEYGAGPEECSWVFKAADDCELEFSIDEYKRGAFDCLEEHLLIGDEYSERRFCEFRHPPPYFYSAGRQLFLAHFRRAFPETRDAVSRISGAVRCIRRPPAPPANLAPNDTCPEQAEPVPCNGTVKADQCSEPGCCSAGGPVSSTLSDGSSLLQVFSSSVLGTGDVCTLQSYSCLIGVLPNETAIARPNPVQGFSRVCDEVFVATRQPGTALFSATFGFNGNAVDHSTGCLPNGPFLCVIQVGLCLSVGPNVTIAA